MHEQYINELTWYAYLKLGYNYGKLIAIIMISSEIIRINKENDFTSFTSVWCWITVQTNFKNWCTRKKFIIFDSWKPTLSSQILFAMKCMLVSEQTA